MFHFNSSESKNTVVSVVSYFILVSEVKQRSGSSQRVPLNSTEVKQRSERSQRLTFNSYEVKQSSERSERFHFDSSEVRQLSERSERFHFSVTYAKEIVFLVACITTVIVNVINMIS